MQRPPDRESFLAMPQRLTLLGMSGTGKTTLAARLPRSRWFHYSGDYRIGKHHLKDALSDWLTAEARRDTAILRGLLDTDAIKVEANISFGNLKALSAFIGQFGDVRRGGVAYDAFLERQTQFRRAEIAAMCDVPYFISRSERLYGYRHFVNDAGGSLCEVFDVPAVVEALTATTHIVYIATDEDEDEDLVNTAERDPKPLSYGPGFFESRVERYLAQTGERADAVDPDRFSMWIFRELLDHRKQLYGEIAARHGTTLPRKQVRHVLREAEQESAASRNRTPVEELFEARFLTLIWDAMAGSAGSR